ncbi:MAG TPA: alanine--glyoxylate aminotransferase family protein [Actinomycetota bacterium]|nr:alanine--glyoxylate aminotransferase family protein [Actinomycetota bacterium]
MDRPEILMSPGPTPVPPEVLLAQGSPLVYHRGPAYGELLREVTEGIKRVMRTDADVYVFASSGTGGLESAVANLFSPGDRVVVPVAGYFGERFAKIAKAYGLDVREIAYDWGRAVKPEDVRAALAEAPTKAVLMQHSETSTGVIHDVEAVGAVTRDAGVLLVVDVVSSLGAVPYDGDAWGVDVAVGGSQKAFSATPGLAFVGVSDAAWEASKTATNPRFYFDWRLYKDSYELKDPENPFTPAISLMLGMRAALRMYFDEGPDRVLARHRILSTAIKAGVKALGLELFGENLEQAWAVTAIKAPEGIDGNELVAKVRADHRIILAPGQGPLKGKVFRIGHLGYYDRFDMIRCLAAIELTLDAMGHPITAGAAVAAAEEVFAAMPDEVTLPADAPTVS